MLIDSSTACIARGQTWFSLIIFQSLLLTTFSLVPDDLVLYLRRNVKTTLHDFLWVFPPLMQNALCRVPPSLGGKAFLSVSSNPPPLFPFPSFWVYPRLSLSFLNIFNVTLPMTISLFTLHHVQVSFILHVFTYFSYPSHYEDFFPSCAYWTPGLWIPILAASARHLLILLLNNYGVWGSSWRAITKIPQMLSSISECFCNSYSIDI